MPPPPPQYQHPTAAGPHRSYPYPRLPPQKQQQQQHQPLNRDNDGSTTVMLPVTFTPGMAPVIHSTTNEGMPRQRPPPPQQPQQYLPRAYPPQFPGIQYRNSMRHVSSLNNMAAAGGSSGGGVGIAASPRYLSMGLPPLPLPHPPAPLLPHQQQQQQQHSTHHQFPNPHPLSASGQVWQAGAAAAAAAAAGPEAGVLRTSTPPPHPRSYSGQDFQATMPSNVTEPLQLSRQHRLPAIAAPAVGRAATSQPPSWPVLRPEEESGDSAPPRQPFSRDQGPVNARKRPQQRNTHGYKSQNKDLADGILNPSPPLLPPQSRAAAVNAATGPSSLQKTSTAPEGALEALAKAAATAAPEASRASRSSARQQHMKSLKQNEMEVTVSGGDAAGKKARRPANTSEALRRELGAALRGSDMSGSGLVPAASPAAAAVDTLPPPPPQQQQQQQPSAVPSSVLHNLSRALADLSRMTASTAPQSTSAPAPPQPPVPMVYPTSTSTQPQAQAHPVGPTFTAAPLVLPDNSTPPAPSSMPYTMQPPQGTQLLNPPGQPQQQQLPAPQPPMASIPPPPPPFSLPSAQRFSKETPYGNHGNAIATTDTEAEVEDSDEEDELKCPGCGSRYSHQTSKYRHMKDCRAVTPSLRAALKEKKKMKKREKKKKDKALLALAPPPSVPTVQFSRPANGPYGPKVSQPLKLEKMSFGPGIFFPRPLKRTRTNIYRKAKVGTAAAGAGAVGGGGGGSNVGAASLGYGYQQAQQTPVVHQQYYPPISTGRFDIPQTASLLQPAFAPPPSTAPITGFAHHHQQASFLTTPGRAILEHGQMMHMQSIPGGLAPPSLHLPNSRSLDFRTDNSETAQVPPPSPQPAPSRLQRSSVATTRAEPMVRIVRDICSPSQLQRLQVDAKMERSLLLPPVPGLPLPPPPPPALGNNEQSYPITATTTTAPTTRGSLLSGKATAAAVAVALAVGADGQHLDQHNQYPRYPDEFTPLFKMNVTIIDESDQAWPVIYEGLACSGQRHVRLSTGWHAMMKGVAVLPGDKVVLERWTDDRTVLHMLVLEGSDEQRAAAAAGEAGVLRSGAGALVPPPRLNSEGGMNVVHNATNTRTNI